MNDETATENATLDQRRARHALDCVRRLQDRDPGHYVSYVSSLPATIVMNGLGQALATLLAKAGRKKKPEDDPHYFLYQHVAGWLTQQIGPLAGEPDRFIDRLMDNDQNVYLRAQAEAMAYLHWLKQFARAYLEEQEGTPE